MPPSPSSADPSPLPVIAVRQTFLGALDTSLTRTWREEERRWRGEDREWRAQDMEFRVEERDWWHLEHLWRQENRKWRREDIEQRILENARWVWLRHAEKNRRDVEEKSEQLKSISNLSALIGGFAVVAFVELQFSDPNETPERNEGLIVAYAATTALVVALMLNSMVLCSFMLCSILRNGKTYVSDEEEADYLFRCRRFASEFKVGDAPPRPHRSFERHWETRCEDDWRHAFRMFTCGVPVFLVNVSCMSWLKFHYSPLASWTVTAIAAVASLGWLHTQNNWGFHIAKSQAGHGRDGTSVGAATHPPAGMPFDWHYREQRAAAGPGSRRADASRAGARGARGGTGAVGAGLGIARRRLSTSWSRTAPRLRPVLLNLRPLLLNLLLLLLLLPRFERRARSTSGRTGRGTRASRRVRSRAGRVPGRGISRRARRRARAKSAQLAKSSPARAHAAQPAKGRRTRRGIRSRTRRRS